MKEQSNGMARLMLNIVEVHKHGLSWAVTARCILYGKGFESGHIGLVSLL